MLNISFNCSIDFDRWSNSICWNSYCVSVRWTRCFSIGQLNIFCIISFPLETILHVSQFIRSSVVTKLLLLLQLDTELLDELLDHQRVGVEVLDDELQHKAVTGGEGDIVQIFAMILLVQHHSGEGRTCNSDCSVDKPNDRETQHQHPPHPQDEEIFLVEDVVLENTEKVCAVQ